MYSNFEKKTPVSLFSVASAVKNLLRSHFRRKINLLGYMPVLDSNINVAIAKNLLVHLCLIKLESLNQ